MNYEYSCPECPDLHQAVELFKENWREILAETGIITVRGLRCGHIWDITPEQVKAARKVFDQP